MGQQVTFNSGSASLEKIVVNSKIDLHRDRRRSEDKQGRGVKWVYGKRGVNGMEGRVKKLNLNPIFAMDVSSGHGLAGCSGRQALGWKRSEMLMESVGRNHTSINHSRKKEKKQQQRYSAFSWSYSCFRKK